MRPPLRDDETLDTALGGAVSLIQPRKGYRFAVDAILLARFAAEQPAARAVDLGCGCGVVALSLLALGGAAEVVGVELLPEMADRATRGAAVNGWADRASFVPADVRRVRELFAPQSVPLVVANPPYRPAGSGRLSPDPAVALARHEVAGTLADVAAAAAHLLGTGGQFCVVYPASRLRVLFAACAGAGLEPKVLRLVHPGAGRSGNLCLLRCGKHAGEGLEVRPPLFLHGPGEGYSAEASALLGPPAAPGSAGSAPPGPARASRDP